VQDFCCSDPFFQLHCRRISDWQTSALACAWSILCIHSSCLILNLVDTTFDSKPFATGATQYYFVFAHSKHGGRKSSDTDTSPGNVSVSQAFSNTAQLMSRSNTARSCFGLSPGHSIDLFSSPCPYVPLGYIGF